MPAPMIPMVPTARDGRPAPGFAPGASGMGIPTLAHSQMGGMLSMNQINPGPAAQARSEPWQGPWLNMNEVTTGAPLNLEAQSFAPDMSAMAGMGYMPNSMGCCAGMGQGEFMGIKHSTLALIAGAAAVYWFFLRPR